MFSVSLQVIVKVSELVYNNFVVKEMLHYLLMETARSVYTAIQSLLLSFQIKPTYPVLLLHIVPYFH